MCFVGVAVYAQDDLALNVAFSDTLVTRYIWRGYDLFSDNDAAHQPSLTLDLSGLPGDITASFNIWASLPFNSGHEDAEEADYTLSLSKDITEEISVASGCTLII